MAKVGKLAAEGPETSQYASADDVIKDGVEQTAKAQGYEAVKTSMHGWDNCPMDKAMAFSKRVYAKDSATWKKIQELVGVSNPDGQLGNTTRLRNTIYAIAAWQRSKDLLGDGQFGNDAKKAAGWVGSTESPVETQKQDKPANPTENGDSAAVESVIGKGTIKLQSDPELRIRDRATREGSNVIGWIKNGAEFEYTKEENGWLRIHSVNGYGWISKQYTSLNDNAAESKSDASSAPKSSDKQVSQDGSFKYFSLAELTQSDTAKKRKIDNSIPNDTIRNNLSALITKALDPIREAYGSAIYVNSGYRCPTLNKAVGGKSNSQHQKGQAADITTTSKEGNKNLFQIIKGLGCFDQLIDESNYRWVHVSYNAAGLRKQALHL